MTKRIPRCWQDGPPDSDENGSTCLLPANHTGPHVWTPDDKIPARYRDHPVLIDDEDLDDDTTPRRTGR